MTYSINVLSRLSSLLLYHLFEQASFHQVKHRHLLPFQDFTHGLCAKELIGSVAEAAVCRDRTTIFHALCMVSTSNQQ